MNNRPKHLTPPSLPPSLPSSSIQTILSALLSGELFSRAGLEKHLHLLASLLSFGLSLGIIAGSCLLRVPQLLNIVRSQVRREGGREEAMEAREALRERKGK